MDAVATVTPWWIDDLAPQLSHVHTHTHPQPHPHTTKMDTNRQKRSSCLLLCAHVHRPTMTGRRSLSLSLTVFRSVTCSGFATMATVNKERRMRLEWWEESERKGEGPTNGTGKKKNPWYFGYLEATGVMMEAFVGLESFETCQFLYPWWRLQSRVQILLNCISKGIYLQPGKNKNNNLQASHPWQPYRKWFLLNFMLYKQIQ